MKKNWNYTKCDEEGNHTSSFKEMVKFIKSNFNGRIKSYDITNNSMEIINECIFEDKGSYVIFYTVNDGCVIVFSIVLLNEFFVYSFGIDENKSKYIDFLDIINGKYGMIEFIK